MTGFPASWLDRAHAEQARRHHRTTAPSGTPGRSWLELEEVGNRVTHAWWRENVDQIIDALAAVR